MTGKKATLGQMLVSVAVGHQCAILYNSVTTESPVLIQRLPEYWDLPVVLAAGFAIVSALVSGILLVLMKVTTGIDLLYRHKPTVLLTLGCLKAILIVLMMTYWDSISTVYGKKYSIAFQVIWVLMLAVETMDLTFGLLFVGTFPQKCIYGFYFGMGCAGTVYGLIAFLQGAGEFYCVNKTQNVTLWTLHGNATTRVHHVKYLNLSDRQTVVFKPLLFSVETNFGIVMGISLCCWASLLAYVVFLRLRPEIPEAETIQLVTRDDAKANTAERVSEDLTERCTCARSSKELKCRTCETISQESAKQHDPKISNREENPTNWKKNVILVTVFACILKALTYGASQPLMAYATLPYGTLTYSLARRISSGVEPLGSIVCAFLPIQSILALTLTLSACVILCLYVCAVGLMSPSPPFVSTYPEIGSGLVISSYILFSVVKCYLRAALATVAAGLGQKALVYYSLVPEFSVALLVLPSFICVDVLKLLTDIPQCA